MNGDLETLETSRDEERFVKVYNTNENVRVVLASREFESAMWLTETQVRELIAILTTVVESEAPCATNEHEIAASATSR